ncbi:MAG: bacillithiol biosynthesis cysteine-adding enzyme BshC [Raineya sp.]|jgi:bacillithiol biosynthesis cysteine-adding enzyme BshC|nr:bacillithiol biosynthesis cysteine-adding enzyme BshC [Raineya sp.]
MQRIKGIPFSETKAFSKIFLDYITQQDSLKEFYQYSPTIENFGEILKKKQFSDNQRKNLQTALKEQYKNLKTSEKTQKNIELLQDAKTFTITTAHQPLIFFGELYFVYKILTTIKLSEALKKRFPEYNFVPVYWMGSEDHDFAEISHFRLFGKRYQWQTTQTGAVGRMHLDIQALFQELPEKIELFETAYTENKTLAKATQWAVNELFEGKGVVVINGDDANLKKNLIPVLHNELKTQKSGQIVREVSGKLENLGYKAQVNPRDINLFYLEENSRERIELVENKYRVVNTNLYFSEKDILQMVENTPEKFSPNAVLRPVYQELSIPNIAYIGGPGEIAYWLQLKEVFNYLKVQGAENLEYPILFPRTFALMVQGSQQQKIEKLGLTIKDLFLDEISLKKYFVEKNSTNDFHLNQEIGEFQEIFKKIQQKAQQIDKSLEGAIAAEEQKTLKSLENLEKRLQKAEERNQETQVAQVLGIKEKLFPNGALQERTDNFLNFYLNNPQWLDNVYDLINPWDFNFQVIGLF